MHEGPNLRQIERLVHVDLGNVHGDCTRRGRSLQEHVAPLEAAAEDVVGGDKGAVGQGLAAAGVGRHQLEGRRE